MKKILMMSALVLSMVAFSACGNKTTKETLEMPADSVAVEEVDTLAVDSVVVEAVDTVAVAE